MGESAYKVGGEVDAKCGKCKDVTRHVIVALIDEKPKRVECLSCRALHNYRPPTAAKKKKTTKRATKSTTRSKVLRENLSEEDAVDYSPDGEYEVDMVLRHKAFGLGKITNIAMGRLTVIFPDRIRRLILKQ